MTTEFDPESSSVQPTTEENVAEVLSDENLDAVSGGFSTLSSTSRKIANKIAYTSTTLSSSNNIEAQTASDIKNSVRDRIV